VDESGLVKVEFVYEPPQTGTSEQLVLERHTTEEGQVGGPHAAHVGGQGHTNRPAVFWRHMEHAMQRLLCLSDSTQHDLMLNLAACVRHDGRPLWRLGWLYLLHKGP
jgi:hypothetical protein